MVISTNGNDFFEGFDLGKKHSLNLKENKFLNSDSEFGAGYQYGYDRIEKRISCAYPSNNTIDEFYIDHDLYLT